MEITLGEKNDFVIGNNKKGEGNQHSLDVYQGARIGLLT